MSHYNKFLPTNPPPACTNYSQLSVGTDTTCLYALPYKISSLATTILINKTFESMLGHVEDSSKLAEHRRSKQAGVPVESYDWRIPWHTLKRVLSLAAVPGFILKLFQKKHYSTH